MGIHERVIEERKMMFLFEESQNVQIDREVFIGLKRKCVIVTTSDDMKMEFRVLNSRWSSHDKDE